MTPLVEPAAGFQAGDANALALAERLIRAGAQTTRATSRAVPPCASRCTNTLNDKGESALQLALRKGHDDIAAALRAAGATR